MPTDHREQLKSIRKFPSLIKYLRDEMDWPLESDSFEDISFEFTPEELGIDSKNAAKIQEIRRLRPLSPSQPWGIFFLKFEPKKLPVVALRRILNKVTLKARASSNSADRKAWEAEDLLFVSNYGEGEDRQITLAHFHQNPEKKDLPVLKVLGWDDRDTALHLDNVADKLTNKLSWPEDENDLEAWRKQWGEAFSLGHREVITTSKKLAVELAKLAQRIRNRIRTVLEVENEHGPLTKLMGTFKEALIDDLDEDAFADMYAQTISYGLLSARIAHRGEGTSDDLASAMPVTNPFLKELMETFLDAGGRKTSSGPRLDFDELGISEVIDLLDAANMEAVVADFGDQNPQEDPVIHFFEGFLQEYDSQIRKDRGVFYTPRPVVSFIVRSVDALLRTEFGLEDGLADTTTWGEMTGRIDDLEIPEGATPDQAFVQILDPATGTGTFLVEVIDLIHKTMTAKWQAEGHGKKKIDELWNDYVPEHLLPRLHGYELMMAPYAIAHMKIGLKLYETGYRFESDERARVYLTNALEPAQDFSGTLAFAIPALANEAEAVNAIKRDQRFTVVIGNPPYSNFGQQNQIPFILELLEEYKRELNEKKINLNDDFIKFIRLSQHAICLSGLGVHGMITNNVFLDGITHRRMRESLSQTLPLIRIVDLHGNVSAHEKTPDGSPDGNVFDITQGVAITLMSRAPKLPCVADFFEVFGTCEEKYRALQDRTFSSACVDRLNPIAPYFFMTPKELDGAEEFSEFWSLPAVFENRSYGIQTKRDNLTIAFDREEIMRKGNDLLSLDTQALREKYGLPADGRDWNIEWAREDLARLDSITKNTKQVWYRPFDTRWTIYTDKSKGFLAYPRWGSMKCMLNENLALVAMRQVFQDIEFYSHFGVTRNLIDERTFYSNRGGTYLFPLFSSSAGDGSAGLFGDKEPNSNLSGSFMRALRLSVTRGVSVSDENTHDVSPEIVFSYIYATLWSPYYRTRYKESLKIDYPRIPLPGDFGLFEDLASLGGELVSVHLLESPKLAEHITTLINSGDTQVEKVSYSDETVWIDKAKTRGFKGVPEEVWNFHIGGYQVCEKWLKDRQPKGGKNDRPGRVLTDEDIEHYQKIVVALSETIRIMAEIDEVIEAHGGWPGAFQTGEDEETSTLEDTDDTSASMAAEEGSLYGEDE